ncbi:MAG: DEAD/DEAH box helicase [Betaproteobacteria bacterium]|nr:DEAD/DEAH box helicase [Betaproteobacteria bacterium]
MNTNSTFADLKLIEPLLKSVQRSGYVHPTPIQKQVIPHLLEGRDLLGIAQTGTGKTAAFSLPLLQTLVENPKRLVPKHVRVLVLTPTRELAIQVHESFQTYGASLRVKLALAFGGVSQVPQVQSLSAGADVLVATPGRLLDLLSQGYVKLDAVDAFVLDEADRMLDMGFIHDIRKILALLPKKRHNLLFSASMAPETDRLVNAILVNPVKVAVTPPSSTAELIQQSVMFVDKAQKRELLAHLFADKALKRVIIFTRTKHGANKVAEFLAQAGVASKAIHGNKSQSARQNALSDFKAGRLRALIATDIAARGIDVDEITHVINYELPNEPETYVHRIGRTARAGTSGVAISFCEAEEIAYLRLIEKVIKKSVPVVLDQPFHSDGAQNSKMRPPVQQQNRGARGNSRQGGSQQRQGGSQPRQGGSQPRQGGSQPRQGGSQQRQGGSQSRPGGSGSQQRSGVRG